MSRTNSHRQDQITEARRLTLISNSRQSQPLNTDIPSFSLPLPSSQIIKPLPKPPKPIKQIKTPQEKKQEKILGYQKKVQKAKAKKLEKDRGPLPEVEEGEYDEFGFWVPSQKEVGGGVSESCDQAEDGDGDQLRLRGGGGGEKEESSQVMEQDHEVAMREALVELQAVPTAQPFSDLFAPDERLGMPPSKHASQASVGFTPHLNTPSKRKRQNEPMTLNDLSPDSSRLRRDTGLPPPTLTQRIHTAHRISAMRGGAGEDTLLGDEQDLPMPVSAQPRNPSIYQTEHDDDIQEEEGVRLSPTEVNSSAIQEPVSRSQTRRSNDRSRVYSLQPASIPINSPHDPAEVCIPPSFAVSDTQPGTPDSPGYISAPGPSRVKTYAKGSKSAPTRQVTTHKSRNPAERREFRDFFSPEPEWEQEHMDIVSNADRSKRAGSTSWWPDPDTPELLHDQESEDDDDDDDEEDEDIEGNVRHILGEVELDERGHRISRARRWSRNRNGPWPNERLRGLFDDDSQDYPRHQELYRPVSERFHLVQIKEEPQNTLVHDTPPLPDEFKHRRKHNHRANHDHPIVHPPRQLIMRRERSVAERLNDYTHKVNSRQSRRQADLPNNPVVVTNIKSRIKNHKRKRSRFDIPNLPPSVLKPIETLPADEYKKQLRSRNAGDGFCNPVLIKAGRLGTRDAIIKHHQSRIRSTGRRGVKTQTPIVDTQGEPDPIEVTQTQVPGDEQPGFAVRQLQRVKATTARYQKLRPKLPFTRHSPPPISSDTSNYGHGMQFTARSPPRPRHDIVEYEVEMEDDEYIPTARPATEVAGLVAPRVGFGSRYKKRAVVFDTHTADRSSPSTTGEGFIRRRPGYHWQPSPAEARAEAMYDQENEMERADPGTSSTLPMENRQYRDQGNIDREPLFLPHEEVDKGVDDTQDQDIDSNASRHDSPPACERNTDTIGLSGAQLCNNLLQSAAKLPIPWKSTSKSRREEKREEMARRIYERDAQTPRPEGKGSNDRVQGTGPLFDEIEDEDDDDDDDDDDVGVGHQPTLSQLKRRLEFGFTTGSTIADQAILMSTQVGDVDNNNLGSANLVTQAQIQPTTQFSSFQADSNAPPARNPGRSDSTPDTPATRTATITDTMAANVTSKLKKTSTTSKFQPPKAVQKVDGGNKRSSSRSRSRPK